MAKRKIKWRVVVVSALLGLALACAPLFDGPKAEEAAVNSQTVEASEKTISIVEPEAGTATVEELKAGLQRMDEGDLSYAKEKPASTNMPEALSKDDASVVGAMDHKEVEKFDEYVLGPEDRLKITVFGETELSGDYRVGSDGTIAFPLVGDVVVEGLTLRQAEESIKEKLRQGYLKKPSVSIEVSESRPFYILGEVRRPGSYNYIAGMSVLQAVAISGGFTYRANRKNVEILRGNQAPAEPMNATTHAKVKPGDIIFIQERFF